VGVLGFGVVVVLATQGGGSTPPREPPLSDMAWVSVDSRPSGAELSVRTASKVTRFGVTPTKLQLPVGEPADVSLSKPGYETVHRTITPIHDDQLGVELLEVTRFAGTWRLPDGELRAFERIGDQVDVYKLDEVAGPRQFFKHYKLVAADRGIAFASDDEIVDPREPDNPRCHVAVHVEYHYQQADDTLELTRPKVSFDEPCVRHDHELETGRLVRVSGGGDRVEVLAPAGVPQKRTQSVPANKSPKLQQKLVPQQPPRSVPNQPLQSQQQFVPEQNAMSPQ
jgi:hypothetical protein